ncbi:D-alanine--D-alanine ligase family protein [Anoxynatronum sibiricum]|uniref:D-alanine--D-alanine ligase n=1 Tax=Anoxynatronum sibiricum TaxID=210623 RepID=A0ABU9VWY6_9CLOT
MTKKRVLVLFGGASSEHEVSLMSAASVLRAMDHSRYEVLAAGITPEGLFEYYEDQAGINTNHWEGFPYRRFVHDPRRPRLLFSPGDGGVYLQNEGLVQPLTVDVIFPVLHGPFGEDGRLQGLLEMCGIPYVGAGVLSSAVAMDKGIAKRLFHQAGIPQTLHVEMRLDPRQPAIHEAVNLVEGRLDYPVFVKPANLGSSVGISKAVSRDELENALRLAAAYDPKVLVEQAVDAREIECAVLGSRNPVVSVPAEVLPSHDFYDYEDKYFSGTSQTQVPANLTPEMTERVQQMALQVYQLLECEGLARVDLFLERNTDRLLVNEINTMPGFTHISLYPKMCEASGIPYSQLIHRLIEDALEKESAVAVSPIGSHPSTTPTN